MEFMAAKEDMVPRHFAVQRDIQCQAKDEVDVFRNSSQPKRRPSVGLLAEVLGEYARHEEETMLNRQRYEQAMLNVFGSKAVIPPQCEHTGPTLPFPSLCSRHLSNPHFAFYMGIVTK